MRRYVSNAGSETRVDFLWALGCKTRAQKVEWVGCEGCNAAGKGATDEGLSCIRKALVWWQGVQKVRSIAVNGELGRAVCYVEEFGRDVAFP